MYHHPYSPFKSNNIVVVNPSRIFGVCKFDQLEPKVLEEMYGSINYTSDYDDLPATLRLWLTYRNWEHISKMAETLGCAEYIFYSDLVEAGDYTTEDCYLLALPLIITDKENCVCLAPKEVRGEHFEVKHSIAIK